MPITYILFSPKLKKFYTGSSREDDEKIRLAHHNSGSVKSTKAGRPWKMVEVELYQSYTDAKKESYF